MNAKKREDVWFLSKQSESNEIKKGKRLNKKRRSALYQIGNQERSDEPHAMFYMAQKESGSGPKCQVMVWLDGEYIWVFVIKERIKKYEESEIKLEWEGKGDWNSWRVFVFELGNFLGY